MPEISPDLPSEKRIYCNRCNNDTNHLLKCDHSRRFYEEENGLLLFWEDEVYRFWVCKGCDKCSLEVCYSMSGMTDAEGNQRYDSSYYPKRKRDNVPTKRFLQLSNKLKQLYIETIECYNSDLNILCAAGLRALIEGICVDKSIEGKNLEKKIDKLTAILPENIVNNLHSFRFMGNDAVHELSPPKRKDLFLAIEVCEDLLNFLYELDYKASRLKIATDKERQNKKNK